jgi:hypothetical protein
MRKLRDTFPGLVPVLAAAVVAYTITCVCWKRLQRDPVLQEPVAGLTTLSGLDKLRDYRALFLFLGCTALGAVSLGALFRALSRDDRRDRVRQALSALLLLALVPACWRLGDALVNAEGHVERLRTSPKWRAGVGPVQHHGGQRAAAARTPTYLVGVLALAALGLLRYRRELTRGLVLDLAGGALLLAVLGTFAGLGVACLIGRAWPQACPANAHRIARFAFGGAAGGLALAAIAFSASRAAVARRRIARGLFLVQIPLPLLFAVLIPPPFLRDGVVHTWPYQPTLPVLIAALVLLSWVGLGRRYRNWARAGGETPWTVQDTLAPLGLSAAAVFVVLPTLLYPLAVPYDHFHFGEQVVSWQQWAEFGKLPYRDLVPIHGLMSLWRGGLNELFFAGTAASFAAAEGVLLALSVAATFLLLRLQIGAVAALILSFYCPFMDRLYLLAPGLLLLVAPGLLQRPGRWLLVWLAVCPLEVFYNAGVGPAFVLGSLPLAVFMAYRLVRARPALAVRGGLIVGAAGAAVLALTPLGSMALGLVRFLAEMQPTNQEVFGLAWEESFGARPTNPKWAGTRVTWELIRLGWVGVVVVAGAVLWRQLARRGGPRPALAWFAGTLVAVLLLATPWTLNQLLPNELNRTGAPTAVVLVCLLPVLLLHRRPLLRAAPALAALAVLVGVVQGVELNGWRTMNLPFAVSRGFTHPHARELLARPFAVGLPPNGAVWRDGAEAGLPRAGAGFVHDPKSWDQLVQLKGVLAGLLRPGETFYDLSNQSALYYYLDLPLPARHLACLTECNRATQARALRELRKDPPPVVLLMPRLFANPCLQCYRIYREWVLRYPAVRRGEFVLLAAPDRAPGAGPPGSADQLPLLDYALYQPDLGMIAARWGRCWHRLRHHFGEPVSVPAARGIPAGDLKPRAGGWYVPCGARPSLRYALDDLSLSGRHADHLKLDLELERPRGTQPPVLEIRWKARATQPAGASGGATGPVSEGSVLVTAANGCLLVPLGSRPRWLLSDRVDSLEIVLRTPERCGALRVTGLQFYHLLTPE